MRPSIPRRCSICDDLLLDDGDACGRCSICSRFPDVEVKGVKRPVVGVRLCGVHHDDNPRGEELSPRARRQVMFMTLAKGGGLGGGLTLTVQELAYAQGYWTRGMLALKLPTVPCGKCSAPVACQDWDTHVCEVETARKLVGAQTGR